MVVHRLLLLLLLLSVIAINAGKFFDTTELDRSIPPTEDFFMYVNGRWFNQTIIPPSTTEYGGMYQMRFDNNYKLKKILDDLIQNETSESLNIDHAVKQKLTDFYLAGLDEQAIERAGIEPLKKTLIDLQNIPTYQGLITFVLDWYKKSNKGLIFEFDVYPDERNISVYMANWRVGTVSKRIETHSLNFSRSSKLVSNFPNKRIIFSMILIRKTFVRIIFNTLIVY